MLKINRTTIKDCEIFNFQAKLILKFSEKFKQTQHILLNLQLQPVDLLFKLPQILQEGEMGAGDRLAQLQGLLCKSGLLQFLKQPSPQMVKLLKVSP